MKRLSIILLALSLSTVAFSQNSNTNKKTEATTESSVDVVLIESSVTNEIIISSDEQILNVEVVSLTGKTVASSRNSNNLVGEDIVIPMARKDGSVYIVTVITESGDETVTLVK